MNVDSEEDVLDDDDEDCYSNEVSNHRRIAVEEATETLSVLPSCNDVTPIARRVPVSPSPYLDCWYKHYRIRVTVDSGATGNMIRLDVAKRLNLNIRKNSQSSNQADGQSHLDVVGEIKVVLQFKHHKLLLEALVAAKLDNEVLGGTPFMEKKQRMGSP